MSEKQAITVNKAMSYVFGLAIVIIGFFIRETLGKIEAAIKESNVEIKNLAIKLDGEINERTTKDKEHDVEIEHLKKEKQIYQLK